MLGSVPPAGRPYVCRFCLGPVTGYAQCYSCHVLFNQTAVPDALRTMVVPMTSVINPSQWYIWLSTYKTYYPERGDVLAALAYEYLQTHAVSIRKWLGSDPTLHTIVPSKRGYTFDTQPLRRALARVPEMRAQLRETLRHDASQRVGRREYNPTAFTRGPASVKGERVLLLEDTWVTGATALSAAGALLDLGAEAVGILPVARMMENAHWPSDHAYIEAMKKPYRAYDPFEWPRA
jgi:hypothetical protein